MDSCDCEILTYRLFVRLCTLVIKRLRILAPLDTEAEPIKQQGSSPYSIILTVGLEVRLAHEWMNGGRDIWMMLHSMTVVHVIVMAHV